MSSIADRNYAMQQTALYNQAGELYSDALIAIREQHNAGQIDDDTAKLREEFLTGRFNEVKTVEEQIAVCTAVLMVCHRNEINYGKQ